MNNETQKIYDGLNPIEKFKWFLGIGKVLENLPQAKARAKRENWWLKNH